MLGTHVNVHASVHTNLNAIGGGVGDARVCVPRAMKQRFQRRPTSTPCFMGDCSVFNRFCAITKTCSGNARHAKICIVIIIVLGFCKVECGYVSVIFG